MRTLFFNIFDLEGTIWTRFFSLHYVYDEYRKSPGHVRYMLLKVVLISFHRYSNAFYTVLQNAQPFASLTLSFSVPHFGVEQPRASTAFFINSNRSPVKQAMC